MAHISSIGAAMFSDLSIATGTVTIGTNAVSIGNPTPASVDSSGLQALFATTTSGAGGFTRLADTDGNSFVREFPSIGTPANIVNVPTYGSKTSSTIQGQADAPSLELTVNYVPSAWVPGFSGVSGTALGNMVGDGTQRWYRFTLLNAEPTGTTAAIKYASLAAGSGGVGTVNNSQFFWKGKMEALLVKPDLKDATTATLTLSIQSPFYGAYTI